MRPTKHPERWAILRRSQNRLDGKREYIQWANTMPLLFKTRGEARSYIATTWAYLKHRDDLRKEPHGWKMPIPIRVQVILQRVKP